MKPNRTITDHVVSSLSPILIMMLVGSLVFFLIQVFYHGKMIDSLRWVMFWFVLGIVLVTRIGIEESTQRAFVFGLCLAVATAFRMVFTTSAHLFGLTLLAIVWWCAHKLTWNCTYVDDDDDATGQGLMETLPDKLRRKNKKNKVPARTAAEKTAERHERLGSTFIKPVKNTTPGLWVIFFSAAALPVFGVGQVLIPAGETLSRRLGFLFLVVYLAAALGLFLTTSFLGLRRYLRQRYLRMPRSIALGWLRFGGGMIFLVLALAQLLPRPGSNYTWKTLAVQVDTQLRRASDFASKNNPHGEGKGRAGDESGGTQDGSAKDNNSSDQQQPQQTQTSDGKPNPDGTTPTQPPATTATTPPTAPTAPAPAPLAQPASPLQNVFRVVVIAVVALVFLWWFIRIYSMILQAIQAFIEALKNFFNSLAGADSPKKSAKPLTETTIDKIQPFTSYQNPFATGADRSWSPEQVVIYTYEAVQAWARARGIEFPPQQTPREFCADLGGKHPEIGHELDRLTIYYAHAAYGTHLPANYDVEPVRQLWRIISN